MSECYHHGILGQKWGVRRFQNKDGSLTAAGKQRYGVDDSRSHSEDNNPKSKKSHKALKIGAGIAVTALAAYGGYRLVKSGKMGSLIEQGKQRVAGMMDGPDGIRQKKISMPAHEGLPKMTHPESARKAITKVNPSGAHNNCYNVVSAFAARLCGYDVTAKGDTQGGKGLKFDDICRVFHLDPDSSKDVKRVASPTVDRVSNIIGKYYKEGDVGAIGLSWNEKYMAFSYTEGNRAGERPGHTLNWIIQNGKVEFMDGQVQYQDSQVRKVLKDFMASDREVSIAKFGNTMVGLNEGTDLEMLKKHCD